MRLVRLDVDEGFLDGLSVEFAPGLNVLIGARGVGKTSVIEILRFVLGAERLTSDAETRSTQQVKSVLGSGLARVTLSDGLEEVVVARSLRDDRPRSTGAIPAVTVLAQNEIEAVGAQPSGRLGLVDRFRSQDDVRTAGQQLILSLRSFGRECRELLANVRVLEERLEDFHDVGEALERAQTEQEALLDGLASTDEEQRQLEALQLRSAQLAAQVEVLGGAQAAVEAAVSQLSSVPLANRLPAWPAAAGAEDLLASARRLVDEAASNLDAAVLAVAEAAAEVHSVHQSVESRQITTDEEARALRSQLESLRAGLGEATRRVEALRDRFAQRAAQVEQLEDARRRYDVAASRRREAYTDLERIRSTRYEERVTVADSLNSALSPTIKVAVTRAGARGAYAASIADLLKGSGIHYNRLAPEMAGEISPIEFVEAVESGDVSRLSWLVNIAPDRAQSIVSYLRDADLTPVLVAPIDDAVDLWLLDGTDYKPATTLSIGQRCTAVLPILLRSEADVLIVDQPEDHLDNAFITGTLVSSLRERGPNSQFIFASHNPNIPVLGEADRIIHMDSDGRRGFVRHQGSLDDPASVRAVTDVMEGGERAFARRAHFYESHRT